MSIQFPKASQVAEEEMECIPRYQEMQYSVSVSKGGQAPEDLWYPKGVATDPNTNQIYVTEAGPLYLSRVSIFSESGVFLNSFSHENMVYPWGIAIHRDNIYVTDKEAHLIFHFKVTADFRLVAQVGGEGSDVGQFSEPRQLTVSTNEEIFVTDSKNHRVQILDCNLHHQRSISHQSMRFPCDVKLTSNLVYILTSHGSPCVNLFSYVGEKLHSLVTCGAIGMQVTIPSFFCLDANENLIISDNGSHQIKIFSKQGTLLHTLGERGCKIGMFIYPYGLALTHNLKLFVVSNNYMHTSQMFSCI